MKQGEKSVSRKRSKRGVTHNKRPSGCGAAHAVLKLARGLPSLRRPGTYRVVERAVRKSQRKDFTIIEFTAVDNHIHLVVEADNAKALTLGMQGFTIRLAKNLNASWGRRGKVFPERYFARFVEKINEVWRLLRYVLQNARKHGLALPPGVPDPFSSARWFRWSGYKGRKPLRSSPVERARFLVTQAAFRKPLSLADLPGDRPPAFV